jgi:hypothetical protein
MTQIVETPRYRLRDTAALDALEDEIEVDDDVWRGRNLAGGLEEPARQLAGAIDDAAPMGVVETALAETRRVLGRIEALERKKARSTLARSLRGVLQFALRPPMDPATGTSAERP